MKCALRYAPGSVWHALSEPSAAGADAVGSEPPCCRFCFDTQPLGDLVSPCKCGGTQRYVHLSCLRQWQRTATLGGQAHKATRCEVCLAPFTCRPPPLSPGERARVAAQGLARWALRCWMYATAASTALGVVAGAQVGAAIVARGAWSVILYVDDQAARSATFALAGALALPLTLPAAVATSYAVILSCITAGGTFGLQLGFIGGPALALGALLRAAAAGVDLSARVLAPRRRS